MLLPVRNGEAFLDEAIRSIVSQTISDWELICIDDGSIDGTPELLRSWSLRDHRIRPIRREPTTLVETLNAGIQHCSGTYVARMDADDVALPRRFEHQLAEMNRRPELDVCGGQAVIIDGRGRKRSRISVPTTPGGCQYSLATFFTIIHPAAFFRTDTLKAFRYSPGGSEEMRLFGRLVGSGLVIGNCRETVLRYRVHGDNTNSVRSDFYEEGAVKHTEDYLKSLGIELGEEFDARAFRECVLGRFAGRQAILSFVQALNQLVDVVERRVKCDRREVTRLHLQNLLRIEAILRSSDEISTLHEVQRWTDSFSKNFRNKCYVFLRRARSYLAHSKTQLPSVISKNAR
ncbi:MAG: glycosyltransferase family 2 protein [Aureliella sp.]